MSGAESRLLVFAAALGGWPRVDVEQELSNGTDPSRKRAGMRRSAPAVL